STRTASYRSTAVQIKNGGRTPWVARRIHRDVLDAHPGQGVEIVNVTFRRTRQGNDAINNGSLGAEGYRCGIEHRANKSQRRSHKWLWHTPGVYQLLLHGCKFSFRCLQFPEISIPQ